MNKIRDFYHVLNKMQQNQSEGDQVDSVIQQLTKYQKLKENEFKPIEKDKTSDFKNLVLKLWEIDKVKLLNLLRRLNSKYEYSQIAQSIMHELFVSPDFFDPFELKKALTEQIELKEVLEAYEVF